jgi:hypothetical protein
VQIKIHKKHLFEINFFAFQICNILLKEATKVFNRGAQYLTGENLKIAWAEFSTLSLAVLFQSKVTVWFAPQSGKLLKSIKK